MKNLISKIFKKQSKIIDIQKRILSDYDLLYFNSLVEVVFIINGIDNKIYKIIGKVDKFSKYDIGIYNSDDKEIKNIRSYGELNLQFLFVNYQRIDNKNPNYKHFGFGSLMMQLFLELINYYEEVNNINFIKITGTIGNGAGDNPDKSIPFYEKFDRYNFGNGCLELNRNGFNKIDRHLEYLIKRKVV